MKPFLIITVLAILLRLFFFLDLYDCCGSDEGIYNQIAQNLAFNNRYATMENGRPNLWKNQPIYGYKPPLYPFFMAGIYKLVGNNYKLVAVVQILLSALTGLILFLIASEIFSKKIGYITLIVYSFFLEMAYMSVLLLSENLYWLLLSIYIYLLIKMKKYNTSLGLIVGVVSGLLVLVRPPSLIFILPVSVWYLWKNINFKSLINAGLMVLFCGLTVLPWTIRNYQVYGQLVLVYTDGGINMWMGNHEGSAGGYNIPKDNDPNQTPVLKSTGVEQELERDNFYYSKSKEFILKNPLSATDLFGAKVLAAFSTSRRAAVVSVINGKKTNPLRPPSKFFDAILEFVVTYQYSLIMVAFIIAVFHFYFKRIYTSGVILIFILILCTLFSIGLTHYEFRYTMQLYPLVIPIAAVSISMLQKVLRSFKI